jgi:Ca2+-binding EF-hand superfamily protein
MALSAASVVNRLRLVETLFHVFDLDNDGKITKEEIGKMLHTLIDVTNSNNKQRRHNHSHANQSEARKQIDLQKRIDEAFNELNANDDDHITKDEFIEWYMKSGLIADVQTNEINVADTSRIQQIEKKKSRKLRKQTTNNGQEENRHRTAQLVRHISRMTERKSASTYDDDDNASYNNNNPTTVSSSHYHNNSDIDDERKLNNTTVRITDDTDSHISKENERWQHLFNSVLGQIRTQRAKEIQQEQPPQSNGENKFHAWKRDSEENLKSESIKQKSNGQQNHSYLSTTNNILQISNDPPPSPEIVTIRL